VKTAVEIGCSTWRACLAPRWNLRQEAGGRLQVRCGALHQCTCFFMSFYMYVHHSLSTKPLAVLGNDGQTRPTCAAKLSLPNHWHFACLTVTALSYFSLTLVPLSTSCRCSPSFPGLAQKLCTHPRRHLHPRTTCDCLATPIPTSQPLVQPPPLNSAARRDTFRGLVPLSTHNLRLLGHTDTNLSASSSLRPSAIPQRNGLSPGCRHG
jgi:hypothetical protein